MYRMDGMSRCQGWQRATHVHGWTVCRGARDGKERRMSMDGRYVAVPWMAKSNACTGCTVCRGAMDGKEQRMSMDGLYAAAAWMHKSNACQGSTGRYLLLGTPLRCSCIALISYIHVTMQYLYFRHPWWSYVARNQGWWSHFRMASRSNPDFALPTIN